MILLLAGTKDGRELAADLISAGFSVLASVTTSYGGALLQEIPGVIVKIGRLDAAGMQRLVDEHRIKGILDATHPFAVEISQLAQDAACTSGRPYLRWERPSAALPESSLLYRVQDWDGVAEKISDLQARSVFWLWGSITWPSSWAILYYHSALLLPGCCPCRRQYPPVCGLD